MVFGEFQNLLLPIKYSRSTATRRREPINEHRNPFAVCWELKCTAFVRSNDLISGFPHIAGVLHFSNPSAYNPSNGVRRKHIYPTTNNIRVLTTTCMTLGCPLRKGCNHPARKIIYAFFCKRTDQTTPEETHDD